MSTDILASHAKAEAWFSIALRPRKPEGSLGRTAQDVQLDFHTTPDLWVMHHVSLLTFVLQAWPVTPWCCTSTTGSCAKEPSAGSCRRWRCLTYLAVSWPSQRRSLTCAATTPLARHPCARYSLVLVSAKNTDSGQGEQGTASKGRMS